MSSELLDWESRYKTSTVTSYLLNLLKKGGTRYKNTGVVFNMKTGINNTLGHPLNLDMKMVTVLKFITVIVLCIENVFALRL